MRISDDADALFHARRVAEREQLLELMKEWDRSGDPHFTVFIHRDTGAVLSFDPTLYCYVCNYRDRSLRIGVGKGLTFRIINNVMLWIKKHSDTLEESSHG